MNVHRLLVERRARVRRFLSGLVVLLLFAISGCGENPGPSIQKNPDTPEVIQNKIKRLEREGEDLRREMHVKYLEFAISGKILDREENAILIFGHSSPREPYVDGDFNPWNHIGTVVNGNILVLNPRLEHGTLYYLGRDNHYFVKKTTGKNAYGADVPLRVFTTAPPKDRIELERKMKNLDKEIKELRARLEKIASSYVPGQTKSNPEGEVKNSAGQPSQPAGMIHQETITQSTHEVSPPSESRSPLSHSQELMGIKYAMVVEQGVLYCHADDAWQAKSDEEKKIFLQQIGKMKLFGKTEFLVKDSKGTRLAEYKNGRITLLNR